MDKIQLTKEALENNTFDFKAACFIPYKDKEEMAEELAQATVICDPDGVAYISYRYDLARMFLIAKYYTNIDTSEWDNQEGREAIFDYMTCSDQTQSRHERMCNSPAFKRDIEIVDELYSRMCSALMLKHEHTSALSYKIGKTFESVLNDQDIVKTLAQSREVNEKLVDMLGIFHKATNENNLPASQGVLNFAKK